MSPMQRYLRTPLLLKLMVLLFITLFPAALATTTTQQIINTHTQLHQLNNRNTDADVTGLVQQYDNHLFNLFILCCSDGPCSRRFYISEKTQIAAQQTTAQQNTGLMRDYQWFQSMYTRWLSRDDGPFNGFEEPVPYTQEDAKWWLRLLRTVHPCTENEVWVQEFGCMCPHTKVCHEIDAANHSWELHLFAPATFLAVGIVVYAAIRSFIGVKELFNRTYERIDTIMKHKIGSRPQENVSARLDTSLMLQPDFEAFLVSTEQQ